jgi:hypothetical protein
MVEAEAKRKGKESKPELPAASRLPAKSAKAKT